MNPGAVKLETFFERVPELFCVADAQGEIQRVNAAFAAAFGREPRELEGQPLWAWAPADDVAAARAAIETLAPGAAVAFGLRWRVREGAHRHINVKAARVGDGGLIFVTARDDTDARRREERLRLVSRATPDGLWERDLTARTLWCSDGLRAQFGWSAAELGIDVWSAYVHPDDQGDVLATLERGSRGELPSWSLEYRFRRKDGSYALVVDRGLVVSDLAGQPRHVLGSLSDVTEQRRAERVMREQAALLDKAREAILVRDIDGRITYWNQAAERMYGWTAAEAAGKTAAQLISKDPLQVKRGEAQLFRLGEWSGELIQRTKDGRELLVEARWTLVRDEAGRPKSVFAIDTDITERKKLESQFLRIQRMESIGTLAGDIAHDLNNILTPILVSAEYLQGLCAGDADAEEALGAIESSARRAADMVQQILLFARGVDGQRLPVRPGPLVTAIAKIARETFGKAIRVTAETDETGWMVAGDPTQLHQVLLNLCVNARDAMPEGGELTIAAGGVIVDQQRAAQHPDARPGRHVVLEVTDTGVGIAESVRDKIFEPFFTTKEVGRGTGLGLSTAAAIVRSHGGFLTVSSELGRGTTFKVFLPAAEDARHEETTRAPSELPRGTGQLILIVDDEPAIRSVAKQTLESFGYEVVTAENGAAAVATYVRRQGEIAAVVTDMAMPIMDGPALMHALKNIDPTVRLVAASGLATAGTVAKATSAGVKTFLHKPYTTEALLVALHDVLGGGDAL